MKPRNLIKLGFATLCCCSELQAAPALSCPPMPAAVTEVNRDVRSDVGLSVGALGKLKAGELSIKTETLAKNLFSQYPDVSRLLTLQMMSSTYYSMLNSIDVPIQDKLDRWERFQDKVLFIQAEVIPPKRAERKGSICRQAATYCARSAGGIVNSASSTQNRKAFLRQTSYSNL